MNTPCLMQDEGGFHPYYSLKQMSRKLPVFLVLILLLLSSAGNVFGQATPGNTSYNVEFWLRSDYIHTPAERPTVEGQDVPVWITVAGPSQNHWGACPVGGTGPATYSVPTLTYNGMNFHEAVQFEGNATQKLASMYKVSTSNSSSYYVFLVTELNTARTTGNYASVLTLGGGYQYNGHGWSGSGRGVWWNSGSASGNVQNTYDPYKPYGITSFIRSNNSAIKLYHNGKGFTGSATSRTGAYSEHAFLANHSLDNFPFYGKMQEVILLSTTGNQDINKQQLDRIHTYLAVKYGQTMDTSGLPIWYATNDTPVWNSTTHSGYNNGTFGLGRDSGTNLNQRIGQNADDKKLTAYLGNTYYDRNALFNDNLFADMSYVIFGHNGQLTGEATYTPASRTFENTTIASNITIKGRSNLVYKAQTTGATSYTISFKTDVTNAKYIMLSNSINFTPGSTRIYELTNDGKATGVQVKNGDYISFVTNIEIGTDVSVTSVSVSPKTLTLSVGGATGNLTATVLPTTASNPALNWTSANDAIATVANGVVTPKAAGTVRITATSTDGSNKSDYCDVTVVVPVTSVTVNTKALELTIGGATGQLATTVLPVNATNPALKWTSSAPAIAEVNETTGVITPKAVGTARITATSTDGSNKSDFGDVTVRAPDVLVTSVAVSPKTLTLSVGGATGDLTALVEPTNATNKVLNWTSANDAIATVANGVVTPKAAGTVRITATSTDGSNKSDYCDVTVVVPVTGVTVSPKTLTLSVGGATGSFTATVLPTTASNKILKWTSSAPAIAEVNETTGVITPKAAGTTRITATSTDGTNISDFGDVTVVVPVTGVSLNKTTTTIDKGQTETLTATVQPSDATNKDVTWSTNAAAVATVSTTGVVTAVGAGTATITVTTVDGNKTATCIVTVNVPVTGVTLNKTTHTFAKGDEEELVATVLPTDASNKSVTWSVDDPTVVSLSGSGNDSRVIKGLKVGTTTVRVKTADGDYEATCTITVNPRLVNKINITPSPVSIVEEETKQLVAEVLPVDADDTSITWSSGNNSIATVSATGLVTAVSEGTVTITATANDGSNVKGTCEVKVTKVVIPVTGITLLPTTLTIAIGDEEELVATVLPIDATTDKSYTWSVEPSDIVSLTNNGIHSRTVMGLKAGTATVKVKTTEGSYEATCVITVNPRLVSSITIKPEPPISLVEGGTQQLSVEIEPTEATDKTVTWSSGNNSIATVSSTGLVTAVSEGTVTITATANDTSNVKGTREVTVTKAKVDVTGIALNKTTLELEKGTKETLTATISPPNATNKKVIWTSSDPLTASVDINTGEVTALKNGGPVTITATSDDNENYKATCAVTIFTSPTGVSLSPSSLSLVVGQSETLIATVSPDDASNKTVAWSSNKPEVATVVNGLVTAVSVGTATITVTTVNGKTAICDVTVSAAPISVTGIALNETTLELEKGTSETLIAIISPDNATNKKVIWTSSDSSIASVDINTGEVTAHKNGGPVTITATSDDNENYKATCEVTVITSVTDVSISPATLSFVLGDSPQSFTATVMPLDASNKAVIWNSDKPEVATVVDGVVTAIGVGTATITVTTVNGDKTDTATVYVSDAEIPVEDVEIVQEDFTLPEGGSGQLTLRFTPADATNQNVTWSSSDDSVAEVSSTGWVTAKKTGEVTITVTTEDGDHVDEIKITVTAAESKQIFINQHLMHLFK